MCNQYKRLNFSDIIVFTPIKHEDNRGEFFENFNFINFKNNLGISFNVVQENTSLSMKNVLRGLHFQIRPYAQAKFVECIYGKIIDVVVDIRKHYESEVGHFKDALIADVERTHDLLPEVKKLLSNHKDKKILLYCTGGIRC